MTGRIPVEQLIRYIKSRGTYAGRAMSLNEAERAILQQHQIVAAYEAEAKERAEKAKVAASVAETMKAWGFDAE